MSKIKGLCTSLFALSLLACTSQPDASTVATLPTITSTIEELTPQPSPSPTLTQVPTHVSTETPNVFTYPFNNPNFATPNPLTSWLESPFVHPSPNGVWIADEGIGLEIRHISGNLIWEIPILNTDAGFWEEEYCGSFSAIQWSPDSRYLFFSWDHCNDGGIGLSNATGLWRLDILSGEIVELISVDGDYRTFESKSLRLSEDTKMLAYTPHIDDFDPENLPTREIVFRDLETEQEVSYLLDEEYFFIGHILWSLDNERVFFVAGDFHELSDRQAIRYDYVLMDIRDGSTQILLEVQGYPLKYLPLHWTETNTIEFQYKNCATWYFDLSVGEFTAQATPTPYPTVGESRECPDK